MKKKNYTAEQIIRMLREADSGLFVTVRSALKHNISQQTFCRWKSKYEGMDLK